MKRPPPQLKEPGKKTDEDRRAILEWFNTNGIITPCHGTVEELFLRYNAKELCIVHDMLMSLNEAVTKWPKAFARMFIGSPSHGISTKYVQIGATLYVIKYESYGNWRSNYGDFQAEVADVQQSYHPTIKFPLFSIDYVQEHIGAKLQYAIDFDWTPKLYGTDIGDYVKQKEIVADLKEAAKHLGVS
jgi:hypothetical protein